MLETLAKSIDEAFSGRVSTLVSGGRLKIELDGLELIVNESGRTQSVSRIRPARLKVDVYDGCGAVPATGAAVAANI